MTTTYPITPRVKELTGTKKRSFNLSPQTSISPTGGWSGGSRDYFDTYCYDSTKDTTNKTWDLKIGDHFSIKSESQEIPAGWLVVETGVFCGKPKCPRIYYRPEEETEVKHYLGIGTELDERK